MDIIWLARNPQGALTRIITIVLLISKAHLASIVTPESMLTSSRRYQRGWRLPTAYVKQEVPSAISTLGVET